ncbi:hypothetical protein SBV1_970020 [Verrucomicrobia bacterium]|nr:hypothetical protein SBV1_970020 [Verrucomicrobiota bacterium]
MRTPPASGPSTVSGVQWQYIPPASRVVKGKDAKVRKGKRGERKPSRTHVRAGRQGWGALSRLYVAEKLGTLARKIGILFQTSLSGCST